MTQVFFPFRASLDKVDKATETDFKWMFHLFRSTVQDKSIYQEKLNEWK